MIRSRFQQRLGSLKKNWALQFSTLLVVTACYLVVCGSWVLSQNFKKILTIWGEDLQMTVYLSEKSGASETQELEKKLRSHPQVGKVRYISRQSALEDFRVQMASYAPDILNEKDILELIPPSFQISLQESLAAVEHVKALDGLASILKNDPAVLDVSYGQDWVQKYSQFLYYFEKACQALGIIIFCAALFVLSNMIRALVQSRRQEIEVLELIGATPGMIRRPFMAEGAVLGLISSLLAVGICYLGYAKMVALFADELRFLQLAEHMQFLSPGAILFFCVTGALLGALGSYLCVRQINDGWAASSL